MNTNALFESGSINYHRLYRSHFGHDVLLSFGLFSAQFANFHICIAGELDGRDYSLTFWITTFFNIPSFSKIS